MPADLRDTEEYRELLELKRLKRQKIADYQVSRLYFISNCSFRPTGKSMKYKETLSFFGGGWRENL